MREHKNFWDRNAGLYDCFMRKDRAVYEKMYELIRPVVKDKTVLEVATGTGLIAKHIVKAAAHIEATDASPEMITEAKRGNYSAKLRFSVQDMFSLPYASKSFDVVIVSNALHIVPQPEKSLREIKRVLKDDGVLIAPTFTHAENSSVAVSGHPFLSIFAAMAAGICSGFVTAILQTKLGVDSLLAGIIVNTALYSVNIAVMGGSSLINMNRTETVFSMMKETLKSTPLKGRGDIVVAFIAVAIVIAFLVFFLRTRLGLAIRATGNNADMVKSSSINPVFTTIVGLCVANSFTALSGCLLSQSQKSVDINIGQGMVTIALASLLIGGTILGRGGIFVRAVGMVLGSFIFRLVYTVALRFNMPAFMLKLVSSVIVVLAISGPYLKKQWPQIKRRMTHRKGVQ